MTTTSAAGPARRSGPDTRAAIQRTALKLFTTQGYEATSMREIAETLGIKKASLYYHFAGKEDIVRSLFLQRGAEADDLLDWIRSQPQTPGLIGTAVLRWVESFSADKLHGIRFLAANPLLVRALAREGSTIGATLTNVVDALAALLPNPAPVDVLHLRMALLSINAAVEAAGPGEFTDDDVLAAAHRTATILTDNLIARAGHDRDSAA